MAGKHASKRRARPVGDMNDKRFYALLIAGFLALAMVLGTLAEIFGG